MLFVHFVQVFRNANRIAEYLIVLHQQGHMDFIGERFCCPCGSTEIDQLKKKAKVMEQKIKKWTQTVENVRDKYYQLNSFTMKQLLRLREELYCPEGLTDHSILLLKALLPCAPESAVALAVQATWLELFKSSDVIPDVRDWSCQESSKDSEKVFEVSEDKQQSLDLEIFVESPALTPPERLAYTNLTESKWTDPHQTLLVILKHGDKDKCVVQEILEEYEKMLLFGENKPTAAVIEEINRHLSTRSSNWMLKGAEDTSISSDQTDSGTTSTSESDEMSTFSPCSSVDFSLSK